MVSSLPSIVVLVTALYFNEGHGLDKRLPRQKRYLDLPKGSSFVVTIAMTTFLTRDILPEKIPTGLGHIVEYDFGYPFPGLAGFRKKPAKKTSQKRKKKKPIIYLDRPYQPWQSEYYIEQENKRRWRKPLRRGKLLKDLSQFISRQGYDGTACINRLSCEAEEHMRFGKSLLEDMALALLPHVTKTKCKQSFSDCSFSPLHILMHSTPIEEPLFGEDSPGP